jgi:hypothetical protein
MLLAVVCVQKCSADQEKVLSGGGDAADSLPESVNFAVDIDMIVDVVLRENMEEEPEEPRVIEHDNQQYKLLKVMRGLRWLALSCAPCISNCGSLALARAACILSCGS